MPLSNPFYEAPEMEEEGPGEIEVEVTTLVDSWKAFVAA